MTPPAPTAKFGSSAWVKAHKPQTAAIAGAGLVGGYALYKRRSSSSSTSSASGTAATDSTPAAASSVTPSYYDSTGIDQYDQLSSAISNLNDQVDALQSAGAVTSVATTSASSAASTVAPANSSVAPKTTTSNAKGFGQEILDGVTYDVLGTVGGTEGTYEVGGGAPVYFSVSGAAPTQGTAQQKTGALILTPSSYAPLISTQAFKNAIVKPA